MLRDLCTALGAVSLASVFLLVVIILVGAIMGSARKPLRRRPVPPHDCGAHETIYAEASAYLEYRCTICHRPRVVGGVRCTGTNRRTRRA